MATPRTPKKVVPIDECLFGPDRACPPNISEAVLSPVRPSRHDHPSAVSTDSTTKSPSSPPSVLSPRSPGRSRGDGLDDLEDGRWEAAIHSPSKQQGTVTPAAEHTISLPDLRRLASQGIVDSGSFRPITWRVLLGYLPLNTAEWKDTLLEHRTLYRSLVSELFNTHDELNKGNELRGHRGRRKANAKQRRKELEKEDASEHGDDKHSADSLEVNSLSTEEESPEKAMETLTLEQNESNPMNEFDDIKEEPVDDANTDSPPSPPTRRRSNSIGGSTPEDVGRLEWRINLTEDPPSSLSATTAHGDGYEALVPARIREEWKRNGRDSTALAGMSSGHGLNTLLVTDHHNSPTAKNEKDDTDSAKDHKKDTEKWHQFFESAALLDEIRKDVVRTHPDLSFFLEPERNLGQRRYAALERILFVWAKLNKGVRYVQGMNEIVGTLYYVIANDVNEQWSCEAEADTYFLFNSLMTEMRDVFVPALDDADTGIQGRIANMKSLLSLHDPEVRCHLDDCGIDASFFAIRWLTTLLSREFLLPDTIRLWDSMFASTHKDNFLRYVCVTMVMVIREDLLKGDFSTCLRLLQSYPTTNLDHLLESSRALWIYESQVTLACHKGGISLHQALSTIHPPPSIVMAYGLPGGVAFRRSEGDSGGSKQTTGVNGSLSSTGRNLVKGAKTFLGGLGREVGNMRKARSTED